MYYSLVNYQIRCVKTTYMKRFSPIWIECVISIFLTLPNNVVIKSFLNAISTSVLCKRLVAIDNYCVVSCHNISFDTNRRASTFRKSHFVGFVLAAVMFSTVNFQFYYNSLTLSFFLFRVLSENEIGFSDSHWHYNTCCKNAFSLTREDVL